MATGAIVARILTQYSGKGTKAAKKDIQNLSTSFDKFSKHAAKSFALVGAASFAMATKIGKDSVQAASEDQKSQALLANSLKNTVGATNEVIASVEDYISKQQMLVGVADDELRPSLQSLVTATGDVSRAQELQNLALDISANRHKDLSSVSIALAKAYAGNFSALKRLGIPLSENLIKSKDFIGITRELASVTKGAATTAANKFAGRMVIMQLRAKEIKETIGYALLPVLQKFADYIGTNILPKIEAWVALNKDQLAKSLQTTLDVLVSVGKKAAAFGIWLSNNMGLVKTFAAVMVATWSVGKVAAFITVLGQVRAAYEILRGVLITTGIANAFATGGIFVGLAATAVAAFAASYAIFNIVKSSDELNKSASTGMLGKLGAKNASATNVMLGKLTATIKTVSKETKTVNALTKEQLATNKAIAALKALGVKNVTDETNPIQLEAARQNLVKQAKIYQDAETAAILAKFEAQMKNVTAAQRYADIVAVIKDGELSDADVINLATKWGMTSQKVIDYIVAAGFTKFTLDKSFTDGPDSVTDAWERARLKSLEYIAAVTGITIPKTGGGGGTVVTPRPIVVTPPPVITSRPYEGTTTPDKPGGYVIGGPNSAVAGVTINVNGTVIDKSGFNEAIQNAMQQINRMGGSISGMSSRGD